MSLKNIKVTDEQVIQFQAFKQEYETKNNIKLNANYEFLQMLLDKWNSKDDMAFKEIEVIREVPIIHEVIKYIDKPVKVGNDVSYKSIVDKIVSNVQWIEKEIIWIPTNKNTETRDRLNKIKEAAKQIA